MARLVATFFLILPVTGCVDLVALDDRPCPCTAGWKCCRDYVCVSEETICAGGQPCSQGCEDGQYCFSETCEVCDDNRNCGLGCTNCTLGSKDWACVEGACGCRVSADCPGVYDCLAGSCERPKPDGGVDAGPTDGGMSDAGGGDGGGDTGPTCEHNNKGCGPACVDCTQGHGNWACVMNRCGCLDDADCLPDQVCEEFTCLPDGSSGLDGGT